jgi:hypothetical protein
MLDKVKKFYEENKKAVLIVGGLVVAFLVYKNLKK